MLPAFVMAVLIACTSVYHLVFLFSGDLGRRPLGLVLRLPARAASIRFAHFPTAGSSKDRDLRESRQEHQDFVVAR